MIAGRETEMITLDHPAPFPLLRPQPHSGTRRTENTSPQPLCSGLFSVPLPTVSHQSSPTDSMDRFWESTAKPRAHSHTHFWTTQMTRVSIGFHRNTAWGRTRLCYSLAGQLKNLPCNTMHPDVGHPAQQGAEWPRQFSSTSTAQSSCSCCSLMAEMGRKSQKLPMCNLPLCMDALKTGV